MRRLTVWSLGVTAACLPLYVVRWRVGPLPTSLLELLVFITIALFLASLVLERRLPAWRTWLHLPIVLLLLSGIAGILAAPDHQRAIGIYRAYFVEAVAIFYVAIDVLRDRVDLRRFLVVASAGIVVMAVGQVVSFGYIAAIHNLKLGDAPAFLNTSPNAVAMYLEPPLAFASAFVLFGESRAERWIAGSLLALVFVAILLTLSRASYLAMTVLAVVFVLSMQTWRWRLRALAGVVVVVGALVEIPFINTRLLDIAHSVGVRSEIYREALRMLSQRPIFGAGISGFPVRVAPFRPRNMPVQLYPHDLWLTTWSEIGLAGVLSFAVIFFGVLVAAARAVRGAGGLSRALLWGVVGALVLYTVHGLVDSPYWKNDLSIEFWLIAALQVVAARLSGAADGATRGDERGRLAQAGREQADVARPR